MRPCQLTEVTPNFTVSDQEYELGQPGFSFGSISFSTDSPCEFTFRYEFIGNPSTLNYSLEQDGQGFTLDPSFDLSLRGQYSVELGAIAEVSDGDDPP